MSHTKSSFVAVTFFTDQFGTTATLYLTAAGRAVLRTADGMGLFLDTYHGVGRWVRDERADIWVVPVGHDAEGRRFLLYELGGDAHPFVLPVGAVQ